MKQRDKSRNVVFCSDSDPADKYYRSFGSVHYFEKIRTQLVIS